MKCLYNLDIVISQLNFIKLKVQKIVFEKFDYLFYLNFKRNVCLVYTPGAANASVKDVQSLQKFKLIISDGLIFFLLISMSLRLSNFFTVEFNSWKNSRYKVLDFNEKRAWWNNVAKIPIFCKFNKLKKRNIVLTLFSEYNCKFLKCNFIQHSFE